MHLRCEFAVSLTLGKLPAHKFLRVRFDLYVLLSWDGNHAEWGPDTWQLDLTGGPILLKTTFGNDGVEDTQAFPDESPWGHHAMQTGAAGKNTLGFIYGRERRVVDSVYKLSFTFPHSGRSVQLNFAATGKIEGVHDDAWGLDNVVVEALDGATPTTDKQLTALWAQLGGADAVEARAAQWAFIAAGERAAEFLRHRPAERAAGGVDPARIRRLIAQLDDDDWRKREQASRELVSLGPSARSALAAAAGGAKSLEAKLRIERSLATPTARQLPPAELRAVRAARALEILTWQSRKTPTTRPASGQR